MNDLNDDILEWIDSDEDKENKKKLFDHQKLVDVNIHLKRYCKYNGHANTFGLKLTDFCKRCNMYILIARLVNDKEKTLYMNVVDRLFHFLFDRYKKKTS